MPRPGKRRSDAFESIMEGLTQAIAHRKGELVDGVRVHHFERQPDGTVHRIEEGGKDPASR